MVSLKDIINPTGGIGYHYTALRHQSLWNSHRAEVSEWLARWNTGAQHLILVGPSGGYSLPQSFLSRFDRVSGSEPDPIARWLFKKRHPNIAIEWLDFDFFGDINGQNPEVPLQILKRFSESAFLFCNILGQVPFLFNGQNDYSKNWLDVFREFCRVANWSSYHDLWSVNRPLAEVLNGYKSTVTITDHLTKDLFGTELILSRHKWYWQMSPTTTHCIEGVRLSKQDWGA